jgi:hypothetical protein
MKFHGCNDDCFNCPYPDCYKPTEQIKHEFNMRTLPFGGNESESQQRMFTLELGGYGGATPNISRKFYL